MSRRIYVMTDKCMYPNAMRRRNHNTSTRIKVRSQARQTCHQPFPMETNKRLELGQKLRRQRLVQMQLAVIP